MDAPRFDRLVASFAAAGGRRGMLRLLVIAPLGGPLVSLLDEHRAAAKRRAAPVQSERKKRKKKKKKKKPPCVPGGCAGNQICLRSGVCQPCTVMCAGTPAQCGAALQTAMNGGGAVYVCPGRYQGGFVLTAAVRVVGAGEGLDAASNTILDANDAGRVLFISPGTGTVELERLRVMDGNVTDGGAGIVHAGTLLRMTECTVSGNVSGDLAGAIDSGGTLEMTRCTVRDNHASASVGNGGGILSIGTTTLTDCLVEDNRAAVGGGLFIAGGTTTLAGTTQVRDNFAVFGGGGVMVQSSTLVVAETCRVTENRAGGPGLGGGIRTLDGTVTLQGAPGSNSPIVVDNCHENCAGSDAVPNCAATPVSC